MPKRGPIVKKLVQYLDQPLPENLFPWKRPNNRLRAIIAKNHQGRLTEAVQEAQRDVVATYMAKLQRQLGGR